MNDVFVDQTRSQDNLLASLFMAAMSSEFMSHGRDYLSPRFRKTEKKQTQCALPGCEVMTIHNGGYCCADHSREHRGRK